MGSLGRDQPVRGCNEMMWGQGRWLGGKDVTRTGPQGMLCGGSCVFSNRRIRLAWRVRRINYLQVCIPVYPQKKKTQKKTPHFVIFYPKRLHVFNSPTPRVFFAEEWVAGESVTARTTFRPFRASVAVAPFSLGGPQSLHDTSTRTAVGTWRATTRDGGTGCFPAAVRKRQALCDARGQGRGDPPRLSPRCAPEGIPRQRAQS